MKAHDSHDQDQHHHQHNWACRASAKLTKLAGSFPLRGLADQGRSRINAKSIMGVMMLAAGIGSELSWKRMAQEQEAMDALVALINDKFMKVSKLEKRCDWRKQQP
ncbi:HPr family phosphocarrier protein [Staphylococcus epidermidis]|nr:HPr family phosphocarrier protein [Staphylococcus epidermidis]